MDDGFEVLGQLREALITLFGDGGQGENAHTHKGHDIVGPSSESILAPRRNSEHLADHRRREGIGKLLDQIHLPILLDFINQPVDNFLNSGPHLFYCFGSKCNTDEPAQASVIGRIHLGHPSGKVFPEWMHLAAQVLGQAPHENRNPL